MSRRRDRSAEIDALSELACSVVEVQRRLDAQYIREIDRFAMSFSALHRALGDAALELAPQRARASVTSVEVEMRVTHQRSLQAGAGVSIAGMLELGYAAHEHGARSSSARLRIEVQQSPVRDWEDEHE